MTCKLYHFKQEQIIKSFSKITHSLPHPVEAVRISKKKSLPFTHKTSKLRALTSKTNAKKAKATLPTLGKQSNLTTWIKKKQNYLPWLLNCFHLWVYYFLFASLGNYIFKKKSKKKVSTTFYDLQTIPF